MILRLLQLLKKLLLPRQICQQIILLFLQLWKKQMCCAWGGVCKNKNPKAWCNKSKKNCEGPCNGEYIDPKKPKPKGCCAWNGKCNPKNFYCNWSRKNCVNRCNGKWKV